MRICIYGAGAMGFSLGAYLKEAGVPSELVTRNTAHVEAMVRHGYNALLPEEMCGQYDIIFLATKQRENRSIAEFLLPYLKEDGALITVQNGLPEEGLAETFGADRVYGCTLGWGAELVNPGELLITSEAQGKQHLALGAYGRGERLEEIISILRGAFEVMVGNLLEIRFAKLVVNASFSTLSAISGLTFGELSKRYKSLVLTLMREVIAVARAYGCKNLIQNGHDILKLFSSPFASLILPIAMKKHRNIRSGMLRDLSAGRRCDVDFVAGACVEAGKKKGVSTPNLERAVALVHDIENGLAETAPESLKLLSERY